MRTEKPVKLLALGRYLPSAVSSDDLEDRLGIPTGWSLARSGVKNRHQVTTETNASMGARAAEDALKNADLHLGDIDLLISASGTFDYPLPSQASVIKHAMADGHNYHTATVDLGSTCLSFVTAYEFAAKLLDGEQTKNILIVTSEISSIGTNPSNWETVTLFGDGAVAAILTLDPTGDSHFIKGEQKTYSAGMPYTIIEGGGNRHHASRVAYDADLHSFKMEGRKLLQMAITSIPPFIESFFHDIKYGLADVDHIVSHQASKAGMKICQHKFGEHAPKMHHSLEKYGNCIAASIPLTLYDGIASGRIKRGDLCFLTGTAAGFSIGGVLIRY